MDAVLFCFVLGRLRSSAPIAGLYVVQARGREKSNESAGNEET
jgi:hypothetical protein